MIAAFWRNASLKTRASLIGLALYGIYVAYAVVNGIVITDGADDPLYALTGINRREQFSGVTAVVLLYLAVPGLLALWQQREALLARIRDHRPAFVILLALVFANALASSFSGVSQDMGGQYLPWLYGWTLAFIAVLVALYWLVLKFIPSLTVSLLLFAGLGALALYSLNYTLAYWFRTQDDGFKIAVVLMTAWLAALLFVFVARRPGTWKTVAGVLTLTAVAPMATTLLASPGTQSTAGHLQRFSSIELASTPDIHVVSLDALAPPELVAQYIGIDPIPYAAVLRQDGVQRFRNAFSSHVATTWALNSVMRLSQSDVGAYRDFFSGRRDSPLAALLHGNGYTVATGFPIPYMGFKGPYVDSYLPDSSTSITQSALCGLADSPVVTFFGFCRIAESLDEPVAAPPWADQVLTILRGHLARTDGPPVFTYYHSLFPGHTPLDYRSGDEEDLARYRTYFQRQSETAVDFLDRLMELPWDTGRPSIVILQGDHGLWVSRTVGFDDDAAFFVHDRHAIALATLVNRTGCSPDDLAHFSPDFATPERLLGGLFRCLARNPTQVDEAMKFGEAFNFTDYLYEEAGQR